MTGFLIEHPGGIAPKIGPKQLANNMAQVATNIRLDRLRFEPWKDIADVTSAVLNVKTIFKYNAGWETADEIQHVVGSLVENDVLDRLYITDSEYPKIRSGAAVYRLGVPPPDVAITVVVNDAGDTSQPLSNINVSYICTFVDAWGAEGPPFTSASITQEVGVGFQTTLTLPGAPTPPNGAGNWNLGPGSLVRIYRSNTGSAGGIFQFVGQVAFGTATFIDTVPAGNLLEPIPSVNWDEPPNDDLTFNPNGPLQGLIEIPNGILAGYTKNTVHFSEPRIPTAWPVNYRFTRTGVIKGLVHIPDGLLVVTDGAPYLIVGHTPEAMTPVELPTNQACVSSRSLVDMGDFAVYASPDGLVSSGAGYPIITNEYVDRDTWRTKYQPETIRAARYEGMYVAFYGDIDDATGFIFDPRQAERGLIDITGKVDAFYYDLPTDILYVGYKQDVTTWRIGEFNGGVPLTFTWTSKQYISPRPISLTVCRVEAEKYPITLSVVADGVVKDTLVIQTNAAVRLSSGYKAKQWEFIISGTNNVSYFGAWESMAEVL